MIDCGGTEKHAVRHPAHADSMKLYYRELA